MTFPKPLQLIVRWMLIFLCIVVSLPADSSSMATQRMGNGSQAILGTKAPLEGSMIVAGPEIAEPTKGDPSKPYIYLYLTGDSAKQVFQLLKARPIDDICLGEGYIMKTEENLVCSGNRKTNNYVCWIGIDIRHQQLHPGYLC